MNLSEWIAKKEKEHQQGDLPGERRRSPRLPPSRVTSCHAVKLPKSRLVPVQLRDISLGGISLIARRLLEPGDFLIITLESAKRSCTIQAKVVHTTQVNREALLAGCAFTRELTSEELAEFS